MAAHPKFDKMAVTVDNSSSNSNVYDANSKEDLEHRLPTGNIKSQTDGMHAKKKSTFKITSVTKNNPRPPIMAVDPPNDADGDSMDDLDETVESHTEELSSEILDSSKYTDLGDQNTPLEDFTHAFGQDSEVIVSNTTGKEVTNKEKTDVHSSTTTRFKVVKIETKEPFRRGRWLCHDLLDTPTTEKSDTKIVKDSIDEQGNSGNSSASSSIHYVHGVDDPAKNPLAVPSMQNQPQGTDGYVVQSDNQNEKYQSKHPATVLPASQDGPHSYVQPNPSMSQIPTSLQTHSQQNFQGMVVNTGPGSPGQARPGQPANISVPVSLQSTSIPQGHIQIPMQVQTPVADSAIMPSSQHSTMPVTATAQIPNSITGQVTPLPAELMKLPQQGGQVLIPSGQPHNNQSTVDLSVVSPAAADSSERNQSEGGEALNSMNIAASLPGMDQTGLDSRLSHQLKPISVSPANFSNLAAPILTPLAVAEAVGGISSPTKIDESGSSTVAIDNKIEQAMDLVKSHLMYAVREEVEVLKEQIQELVEKNNQLEYENSILRASASQETLSKLQAPRQQQPPSSSSS